MFGKRTVEDNAGGAEKLAIGALRGNGGCGRHYESLDFTTKKIYRGNVYNRKKRSVAPESRISGSSNP
jgi:hypothetical protein